MKTCTKCKLELPLNMFTRHLRSNDKLYPSCKKCVAAWNRSWYQRNKESQCRYRKKQRFQYRQRVLDAYGGKCVCCSESEPSMLAIDHIHGGGNKERKNLYQCTHTLFKILKDQGWPKDRYQLLCHNCNYSKHYYGQCAHKFKMMVAA